jgi:hypothetical protein
LAVEIYYEFIYAGPPPIERLFCELNDVWCREMLLFIVVA